MGQPTIRLVEPETGSEQTTRPGYLYRHFDAAGALLYVGKSLDQKIVRELLDYEPLTGLLWWKTRDRKWFATEHDWKAWNAQWAGKPALTATDDHGYKCGSIFNKRCDAHRIIFLWMTGREAVEVDHINHIRSDNRWINLREVDKVDSARNQTLQRNKTSGYAGVGKHGNGWQVHFPDDEGHRRCRHFPTYEQAISFREAMERKRGFHPNHGAPPNLEVLL